jgi:hypothetical protein
VVTIRIDAGCRTVLPDGTIELAADVAGERLWFKVPGDRPAELRGEPFVCAALVAAMRRGVPIEVDPALPVSATFLAGTERYMNVMRLWGPALGWSLRVVPVRARTAPTLASAGRGAFFSGGVDGLFTMLEAREVLDAGVFVHGIDFQLDNPMAAEACARNAAWLRGLDKELVEMSTNLRWVGMRLGVRWNDHNGACLAGCAHALGLADAYIASGHAWLDTMPGATHRVIDPELGGDRLQVHHHGFGPMRWEKLQRIARAPGALELLRVCWHDRAYNCGSCEKCIRTMYLLQALGLGMPSFPAPASPAALRPGPVTNINDRSYALQALALARGRGDAATVTRLTAQLRRYAWRNLLNRADQACLGGLAGRVRRAILRPRRNAT